MVQRANRSEGIGIAGLNEFLRDLGKAGGPELKNRVKQVNREVSDQIAAKAAARGRAVYRPSPNIARAIASSPTVKSARIRLNTSGDPRIFGAEFGAHVHRIPVGRTGKTRGWPAAAMSRRVFPAWTGNQWQQGEGPVKGVGTALFPVIRENKDRIRETYLEAVFDALATAFPDK